MRTRIVLLFAAAALLAAADAVPRPEYPQPQFQRDRWMSLNGTWEFEFDNDNAGLAARWSDGSRKFSRTILVPFCPESPRSGIGDPGFHPWV